MGSLHVEVALARLGWLIPSRVTSSRLYYLVSPFPSFFLSPSIISIMDSSTLMALTSQVKMLHTVCDGQLNPIDSPNEGVFVI
jgi:hypothetical protein